MMMMMMMMMRLRQALVLTALLVTLATSFVPHTTRLHSRPRSTSQLKSCDLTEADDHDAIVILRQPWDGKSIECAIHSMAKIEGDPMQYVVAIPADPCVDICEINAKTDELTTVEEDDPLMDGLFAAACAVLEEEDLFLTRSATSLTLQGDLDEDDEEDDDDDYPEDVELGSFEFEGSDYCIIKVGMPLLLIAKATSAEVGASETGYELLEEEENERVLVFIQEELDLQFDVQVEQE
mmetsp:Transcript_53138/g.105390  ORF Transcript_53138/g.105390 Transcript_53138/m.105390 type:complete len:237 (-) Transcript_53138:117-827(-)